MLKLTTWVFIFILACSLAARAQGDVERIAVEQAVLDYVEGVYKVAPERIERSVHPGLVKRGFYVKKGESAYSFKPMTFAELVNLAETYNKNGRVAKDAPKEVTVYDVLDQTATAKLVAAWGVDYLQLAKFKGKWMIVNVLWQTAPRSSAQASQTDAPTRREVAVTFDDLPTAYGGIIEAKRELTTKLLRSITSNNIPAVGFVNESKLYQPGEMDARVALLQMWLDAGLELGNHTFSHINNKEVSLAAYQEDVIRGETVTRRLLETKGAKLRYFRHPYLLTGPTVEYKQGLERFLAERGYTVAPVTIDNSDYIFASIYARAKQRGDAATMKRVGEAYIPYMEKMFEYFETLSRDSLGYEIKQVLLLHANELNADYFDALAKMMKKRGYKFVSLQDALKDKAYALAEAQTAKGMSWLHRWMLAKGQQITIEPSEPDFITKLFKTK